MAQKTNDAIVRGAMNRQAPDVDGTWREQVQATYEANKGNILAQQLESSRANLAQLQIAVEAQTAKIKALEAEIASVESEPVVTDDGQSE